MSYKVTTVYYWLSYMLAIPDNVSGNNYLELVRNEKHQTQQTDTIYLLYLDWLLLIHLLKF